MGCLDALMQFCSIHSIGNIAFFTHVKKGEKSFYLCVGNILLIWDEWKFVSRARSVQVIWPERFGPATFGPKPLINRYG